MWFKPMQVFENLSQVESSLSSSSNFGVKLKLILFFEFKLSQVFLSFNQNMYVFLSTGINICYLTRLKITIKLKETQINQVFINIYTQKSSKNFRAFSRFD